MFCFNCGKQLEDHMKFCPGCGAKQSDSGQQYSGKQTKNSGNKGKVLIIAVAALALILLLIIGAVMTIVVLNKRDKTEVYVPAETTAAVETRVLPQPVETEPEIPEDGWHMENGERYYYSDGQMYVDLQEIDGEVYYFYSDGALAVNEEVDLDGYRLDADRNGAITGITYDRVIGDWSGEKFHYGNSGKCSVIELPAELENCDSCTLYLEAEGQHGAKVNGTWKVYVRSNGEWEYVQEISFTEPDGSFKLRFNRPKNFDAITAHPTVQGNASYGAWFCLEDVHCVF